MPDSTRLTRRALLRSTGVIAGTAIAAHAHDTENCGVVTQGELILITNGSERRFGPGAWYRLAPGEVHAARFEVETSEIEFWFRAPREGATASSGTR